MHSHEYSDIQHRINHASPPLKADLPLEVLIRRRQVSGREARAQPCPDRGPAKQQDAAQREEARRSQSDSILQIGGIDPRQTRGDCAGMRGRRGDAT
jgi:hypothetical protein